MSGTLTGRVAVINGYSARLSGACLQHVLTDPDVEYVEVRSTLAPQFISGGTHKSCRRMAFLRSIMRTPRFF